MTDRVLSRRRFLANTALAGAGGGALLLAAQPASAFQIQPMDAETHALYMNHCGGKDASAYHQELLTEAKAKLPGTLSDREIAAALAELTCPVCGCSLAS